MRQTALSGRVRLVLLDTTSDWDSLLDEYANGPKSERDILANIFATIRTRECNAVACEEQYVDRDYRAEFASIYSRVHQAPGRNTTRLTFFVIDPEHHKVGRLPEQDCGSGSEQATSCLGYAVLRPLKIGRVGRSFIATPLWPEHAMVTCRAENHTHLGHQRCSTDGSPFIHQDAMVMVCAQASIWMSLHYMHVRFGEPRFLPSDITERAYRNLSWHGAPVPTAGLTLQHMVNAVAHLGYAPVFNTFCPPQRISESEPNAAEKRVSKLLRFVMPYLESQLPVILVLPQHAVCAVGYVLAEKHFANIECVQRLADWTAGLIAHDDAVGPYRMLRRDTATGSREDFWNGFQPFISKHNLEDVQAAIVPLPQRVHCTADAIENHVASLLMDRFGRLNALANFVRQSGEVSAGFAEWERARLGEDSDRLTLRTYLMDTIDYLRATRSADFDSFSSVLQNHYASSDWPRCIWISELIPRARMESRKDRKVIGEIISDPTANRYDAPFLAIHVPGFLMDGREQEGAQARRLPDDQPYSFGSTATCARRGRPF